MATFDLQGTLGKGEGEGQDLPGAEASGLEDAAWEAEGRRMGGGGFRSSLEAVMRNFSSILSSREASGTF